MNYRPYLDLSTAELAAADPGELNLKLAVDLPGSQDLDIPALVHQLNKWANAVRKFTDKMRGQYLRDPSRYGNSLGQFRVGCMLTVIQRDFGVAYRQDLLEGEWDARDSRTLFIHGPLTGYGGTCANLPILYRAIGWRLGYPLHLVRCEEHLFLRWEDESERFNFEATTHGLVVHPDEYYRHKPRPANPERLRSGEYLTNLTHSQALGLMLLQRVHVLRDHLRSDEGIICTRLAESYDRFYENEISWQREFHELIQQLCRRFGVPFTKLLPELCYQLDWKWIAHDFSLLAKDRAQELERNEVFGILLRIVRLRMKDFEKSRGIGEQNKGKSITFSEAADVSCQ